jgi:hypothetical protein
LENVEIRVFNAAGMLVYTEKIGYGTQRQLMDLSFLSEGIYVIYVDTEAFSITEKLLIAR